MAVEQVLNPPSLLGFSSVQVPFLAVVYIADARAGGEWRMSPLQVAPVFLPRVAR